MKLKYFYKYYYIVNKLKSSKGNNNNYNKIKKDSNQIIIMNYNNNKKGKRKGILRERIISNENTNHDTRIFPINNIYNKFNFFNAPNVIQNNNIIGDKCININKSPNIIKNYRNTDCLDYIMEQKNKNRNSFLYQFKNKNNKINSTKNNSLKNNKMTGNKSKDNILEKNNNIIMNYINEMDKFNRIMKQKSCILTSNNKNLSSSNKKFGNKLYTHRKTNSCINTPFLNRVSEINTNLYSFSNHTNKLKKNNTDENKLFMKNKSHISIECHSNSKKKRNFINSNKKGKNRLLLKKDFLKSSIDNDYNENNIIYNNVNNDIFNEINSSNFHRTKKSSYTYKKGNDYYYQNNTLNYFKNNSFLSTNFFSSKNNLNNYSNHKSNNSNNNIFSPILLNRINSQKFKKIPNSNSSIYKINSNLINAKNRNLLKTNLLDNNNTLSTTYKDKQTIKDMDESGINSYMKNNTSRNVNIEKSKTSFNQNKNSIFTTNQKNNLKVNKINYFEKNNSSINYFNKEIPQENKYKTNIKKRSYNMPISSNKKTNRILQNISFSNNSSDKPINENNLQSLNKPNKNNISSNNKYFNFNNKFKQYNNIRISSLFSILKEDKKITKKKEEENKPKEFSCMNIINECFKNKNQKNIEESVNNKKEKEKLETSFESLSDSKIYELAKNFIPKEECLDKHAMEQILKNKNYNK